MNRVNVSSGSPWEASVGYSRAVRIDNQVFVSGTTASNADGEASFVNDPYGQTKFIFEKIKSALHEAGADLSDVVRTRMFVTDITKWEGIGRAHSEVFGEIRPAATMVEVRRLINPDLLVEIEVDAVVSTSTRGMRDLG